MIKYIKKRPENSDAKEDSLVIEETVRSILNDIRKNGHKAVQEYSKKFDNWDPADFQLTQDQIKEAISKLSKTEIEDIKFAQNQIRNFAQKLVF